MAVASIVCVDGELDVHDTARSAVKAAIERSTEVARIGICVGDIEIGDPLGLAKRLCEVAPPGAILVTDSIRRAVDDDGFIDLGAVSIAGYRDRVQVFELRGVRARRRTVLSIEMVRDTRLVAATDEEEDARFAAQLLAYDRTVWRIAFAHRGFVDHSRGTEHAIAFERPLEALRAALALDAAMTAHHDALGSLRLGVDRGVMTYLADHWWSTAWRTAERVRSSRFRHLGASMALVNEVGQPALRQLGLVIEVVEEVVQKGVLDPVSVAHLRMP
jgi:class 3 adenylate cyclase